MKLTAKVQVLERNIRNFVGQDLDPLSTKVLQSLEQQLDTSLKRIRTRKNQIMNQNISEMHKKTRALQEQNSKLAKMKEKEKTKKLTDEGPQSCPETTGQQCSSTSNLYSPKLMPPQTQFPSLTHGETLQARLSLEETVEARIAPSSGTLIPPWMLHHLTS
ncbi:agamous-like MADS-box protein FUL-L [Lotus japonicus]|uniref:agamous-like MADS-box protein FUL-L n=1 Tax=Lotus japonicus TaxID=34305 RepID=UPI00258D1328|nr:agamous-like MADS-box protein FUL-L [Lotus japonicus]